VSKFDGCFGHRVIALHRRDAGIVLMVPAWPDD
jgi:hypothetical protein